MTQTRRSPITRLGVALGATFLILGSFISGFVLLRIVMEARATEKWPTVDGRLSRARIAEVGVGRYRADVAYDYEVNGQNYTGSRVRTSDGEYDARDGAAQAIQGLQAGQPVTVYYKPADPATSVLRAGAGFQEYALIAVPGIMFAMGCFAFLRAWRMGSAA
jgi:hypothetical protein